MSDMAEATSPLGLAIELALTIPLTTHTAPSSRPSGGRTTMRALRALLRLLKAVARIALKFMQPGFCSNLLEPTRTRSSTSADCRTCGSLGRAVFTRTYYAPLCPLVIALRLPLPAKRPEAMTELFPTMPCGGHSTGMGPSGSCRASRGRPSSRATSAPYAPPWRYDPDGRPAP